MLVATTLLTVVSIVSELSTATAKAVVCAGVLNSSAVMPLICMLDETTTTGTTTTEVGAVGNKATWGATVGADLGTMVGSSDGAWDGT